MSFIIDKSKKDDCAMILDYNLIEYISDLSKFDEEPVIQAIGTNTFSLYEVYPKEPIFIKIDETFSLDESEDNVFSNSRKIELKDLTKNAKLELVLAIEDIIRDDEERFLPYFNDGSFIYDESLNDCPQMSDEFKEAFIKARKEGPFESLHGMEDTLTYIYEPVYVLIYDIKRQIK